jgi:hypothetical protein
MFDDKDFYSILGVGRDATQAEIKKAYRKKAQIYHPDHGGSNELMDKINYAYHQLSNPQIRENYNRTSSGDSQRKTNNYKKTHRHSGKDEKSSNPRHEENYTNATFVDGIEATDSTGRTDYIRRGDFIYFPVSFGNQFLFFTFKGKEYYRAKVKKVYSHKYNHFSITPLFVVEVESFEQVVFQDDYRAYWISQRSYIRNDNISAIKTFVYWISGILLILMLLNYGYHNRLAETGNANTDSPVYVSEKVRS